jgi:formylglycine-generating enzyme required for sulfatase activity
MHGNVSEWCQDWFDYYPGGMAVDPPGPASGSDRVRRGGYWRRWGNDARDCRSAGRRSYDPAGALYYLGFRVVLAPGQ